MTPEELLSHQRFVRDLAGRLVSDAATADDVAQDTLLLAVERPPRSGAHPRAWLATVMRNLIRRGVRGQRRRLERERAAARREAIPAADDAIERLSWHRRVVEAVLALEEPYRRTVILRHYESLPPREVARLMDVPAATVRTRLYRAYALLRTHLGPREEWRAGVLALLLPTPRESLTGVLLMSTKSKVALVLVAALAVVAGLYATRPGSRASALRSSVAETAPPTPPSPPGIQVAATPAPAAPIDRDRDLHGVVVDGEDTPVAGALVETFFAPWQRARLGTLDIADDTVPGPAARTGADGTFAVRLRAGDNVALRASADGFAVAHMPARQAGERVKVVLSRGASVVVTVREVLQGTEGMPQEEAPVTGARVTIEPGVLAKNRDWDLIFETRRETTGADGVCRFDGLEAPVDARLEVESMDHEWFSDTVAVAGSGETRVEVRLRRGHVARGVVVDADTGAPIEGAEVGIDPLPRKVVRTGRDGRFELRGAGRTFAARAEGYALAKVIVAKRDPPDYRQLGATGFRDLQGEDVEIRLSKGARATGRVLGADGSPIEGAFVAATGSGAFGVMDPRATRSRADGTFVLEALQPLVNPHLLVIMAPGRGRVLFRFDAPERVDLGDIRLPPARTITGRVVGPRGDPVPRVRVFLRGCNDDKDRLLSAPAKDVPLWWGNTEFRFTDDLGRFRFPDLAPGTYELTARPEDGPAVPREVNAAEDVDVELRLEYAHELTVRVVDGQAVAVTDARVVVHYGREMVWKDVDDQGVAVFALPAPPTRVGASGPQWCFLPSKPGDVEGGATEVTLTLRRVDAVSGLLLDAGGAPVAEVLIASECDGERIGFTRTDAKGRFQAVAPRGGAVDLVVVSDDRSGELRAVPAGSSGLVLVAR